MATSVDDRTVQVCSVVCSMQPIPGSKAHVSVVGMVNLGPNPVSSSSDQRKRTIEASTSPAVNPWKVATMLSKSSG